MLSHAVAKKPFNMAHWFFIVVLLALTPLAVNAHQLTGTVYLGGDPLPGTELTVYDNNRNALQSVNTNEAGSYAVDLPDGTYDLVITPPFELGLSDTLIDDIVIAEQDVVFHFVLLRPEIVLSGVVSAADGTPLSGVELAVYNQQSGENAGYLTTDESGAYSFPVAEGTYNIVAFGYGRNSNIALPDYWKIDPLVNSLVLHEDQIMNLNLPDVRLTGRVNSVNGSGVPDVTLSIRESWQDAGSNYLVQYSNNSLKTDNNGQYSLTVFDRAQYDVSLYPPVDSGFANTVVENNPVEGDTEIDFVLNDAIYLSGKVLTPSNIPVSQVELMVFNIETQHFVGRYTTSEDGEYIFPLRPGLYKIDANGYGQYSNIRLPRRWSISPLADQIPLASDRRFDLVLPVVQLSGVITNENDEPQPNVAAEINQRWNAGDVAYAISIDQNHVLSNSQGQFNFYTFIYTDYSLNLIPQDSRQYATTQYTGLALSQDTVRNFSLSGASRLTGIVTTPGGQPVDGVTLTAIDQTTNLKIASVMTLVDGRYEFHLAPGVYKINAQGYAKDSTQPMPQIWGIQPVLKDLIINGIHEHNIELPLVKITGRIFDSAGTAVAAVQLEVKNAWYDTDGVLYSVNNSGGFVTSDADGYYTVMVLSHDDYQIQLTPPEDAVLLTELINGIDASVNGVHDLVFSPALALEGVVKDDRGNLVSGVNLEFVSRESRRTINRASTDQQGYYRAVLREGNYDITITDSDSPSNLPLPNQFYMAPIVSNYALQNDSTLDLQLPLVNLSGKALDSNGVPVANVQLFINERWKHAGTTFSVFAYGDKFKTDAQGEYRIALFPYANYSQQIIPPKASGFTTATIDNFSLERDSLQDIILSLPDTKPPVIVAGPYVTQITDISAVVQWQTDEATLGRTVYGTGDLLGQEANDPVYHRTHTMQLNELVPQTTYSLRVFSDDYNHNGAVNSDVVTFTTLALPDTQFPLILEGPSINAITQGSAVLSWVTNEPSRAMVRFGRTLADAPSTQDLSDFVVIDELNTNHEIVLQDLQADTAYSVLVEVQDAAGHGPVQSPLKSFFTLANPDTVAPMIIAGPIVTDITNNGAIVRWETDEPATSGVSYNDGSRHGVVSDGELVTSHSVVLTQLNADTVYQFTVSSSDGFGNGPVLSEQQAFSTDTQMDRQPPVIIEGPEIINITHQSVVIRWQTDEAADSLIEYGIGSEELFIQEARSALLNHHNLPITGLSPETTYYFRVSSTDSQGNRSSASDVYSFTTKSKGAIPKPTVSSAPKIIQLSDSTATVYWETNVAGDSVVRYGTGAMRLRKEYSSKSLTHQVTLTELNPDTDYQLSVASHEPASDDTTVEVPHVVTFRTQAVTDTQAPEVSGSVIVKVLDDTMVQIQWQTDEIADSRVQYNSKGKSLSKSAGSLSRSKNHKAILTNLTYGERYGFKVSSQDIYGNRYESGVMEFTTKEDSVHSASDNQESQGGGGIGLVMIMSLLLFNLQAGWRREGGDLCLSVSRLLNWRPWAS